MLVVRAGVVIGAVAGCAVVATDACEAGAAGAAGIDAAAGAGAGAGAAAGAVLDGDCSDDDCTDGDAAAAGNEVEVSAALNVDEYCSSMGHHD